MHSCLMTATGSLSIGLGSHNVGVARCVVIPLFFSWLMRKPNPVPGKLPFARASAVGWARNILFASVVMCHRMWAPVA